MYKFLRNGTDDTKFCTKLNHGCTHSNILLNLVVQALWCIHASHTKFSMCELNYGHVHSSTSRCSSTTEYKYSIELNLQYPTIPVCVYRCVYTHTFALLLNLEILNGYHRFYSLATCTWLKTVGQIKLIDHLAQECAARSKW
jgi:hypothetical protein